MFAVVKYRIDSHDDADLKTREVVSEPTTLEDATTDFETECKLSRIAGFLFETVGAEKAYLRADSGNSYMVQVEEVEV